MKKKKGEGILRSKRELDIIRKAGSPMGPGQYDVNDFPLKPANTFYSKFKNNSGRFLFRLLKQDLDWSIFLKQRYQVYNIIRSWAI